MESFNPLFTSAVSSGQISGAVLAASSPDGRFNYLKAFGGTFCEADSPALAGMWPKGGKVKCNHSLGGLVVMEDLSTGRKRGSLMWFGSSMIVWIDPTSQVGGFFGSQIVPGTPHVIEASAAFEKAVYDTLKQDA